jgi:hypothetical protein
MMYISRVREMYFVSPDSGAKAMRLRPNKKIPGHRCPGIFIA